MNNPVAILFNEDRRPGEDHPGQKPSRLAGRVPTNYRPPTSFSEFTTKYYRKYGRQVSTTCPPGAGCLVHAKLVDLRLGSTGGPVVRLRFPYTLDEQAMIALRGSVFLFCGSSGQLTGYTVNVVFRTALGGSYVVEFRMNDSPRDMPAMVNDTYRIPLHAFLFVHPKGPRSPKMSRRDLRGREPAR